MDWRELAFGLGGFVGGLVMSLLKAVFPAYLELAKENRELRAECEELRERLRETEDALDDMEERR